MVDKIYCDSCGKFIKTKHSIGDDKREGGGTFWINRGGHTVNIYDLCKDCAFKMDDYFFKNPKFWEE